MAGSAVVLSARHSGAYLPCRWSGCTGKHQFAQLFCISFELTRKGLILHHLFVCSNSTTQPAWLRDDHGCSVLQHMMAAGSVAWCHCFLLVAPDRNQETAGVYGFFAAPSVHHLVPDHPDVFIQTGIVLQRALAPSASLPAQCISAKLGHA